jgi:tetratricopeptide (TPR) repeat protein
VKGRVLVWPVLAVLVLGLSGQTLRWRYRLTASRVLRQVETLTMAGMSAGRLSPQLIASNLQALRRAAPLDPVEVGIPIARGAQYMVLGRNDEAARAYAEALALEPRPEGYLNLGRALWHAGRRDEARRNFEIAVRLDPRLADVIAEEAR